MRGLIGDRFLRRFAKGIKPQMKSNTLANSDPKIEHDGNMTGDVEEIKPESKSNKGYTVQNTAEPLNPTHPMANSKEKYENSSENR